MFYKFENELLLSGPFVQLPSGVFLHLDHMDEVTLPHEGWYYFETEQEAKNFFNITE